MVGNCGDKIEVSEAGARRGVVGYENVRLLNVRNGTVAKKKDTDPFEVPMYNVGTMEVLQTLSRPVQLSSQFNDGSGRKVKRRTSSSLLV